MKFLSLFTVYFIAVLSTYAQAQKGYYITDSGSRVDVYFKPTDFTKPESLEIRKTETEEYHPLLISTIKEYGIEDQFKLVNKTVKADKSKSSSSRYYSNFKEPDWEKTELFLNVLVEGDASLYSGIFNGEKKYFYSVDSKGIKLSQLVYKVYLYGNQIKENNDYLQTLYNEVRCSENNQVNFEALSYSESSLKKVFETYNECNGSQYKTYDNKGSLKIEMHVSGYAGASMNMLSAKTDGGSDSNSSLGFNIGGEIMIVMPTSKLGGFLRMEYANATEIKTLTPFANTDRLVEESVLNAGFLNIVLGPRYFISKNKNKKGLFIDAAFGMNFAFGDLIKNQLATNTDGEHYITSSKTYSLAHNFYISTGVGYAVSEKLGIEVRFDTPREVVNYNSNYKYSRLGLNFKYTFK